MVNRRRSSDVERVSSEENHEHPRHAVIKKNEKQTRSAVDQLIGKEITAAPGMRESRETLLEPEKSSSVLHSRHKEKQMTAPMPQAGMEQDSTAKPMLQKESSGPEFAADAGKGAAVILGGAVGASAIGNGAMLTALGAGQAGAVLAALPVAGAAAGYAIGRTFKHPIVGAALGTAVGGLAGTGIITAGLPGATAVAGAAAAGVAALNVLPVVLIGGAIYGVGAHMLRKR